VPINAINALNCCCGPPVQNQRGRQSIYPLCFMDVELLQQRITSAHTYVQVGEGSGLSLETLELNR
jgi:hypothetical protein